VDNSETTDDSPVVYGDTLSGKFTIKNNDESTDFNNNIVLRLFEWTGNNGMSIADKLSNITIAKGQTVELPFSFNVEYGKSYSVALIYINGQTQTDIYTGYNNYKNVYTIYHAPIAYKADGTRSVITTNEITIGSDIVAIDLTGIGNIEKVTANENPNFIYYVDDDTKSLVSSGNIVVNNEADEFTLTDGYDFYIPKSFTAKKATYTRTITQGLNKGDESGKYWETLMLPFAAKSVTADGKTVDWFHSSTDEGKNFWLCQFVSETDATVKFDHVDDFEANVPYIISVPGNKWGEKWNLTNKPLVFSAENAVVVENANSTVTGSIYKFKASNRDQQASGYFINDGGTAFENQSDGNVKAFRAYFAKTAAHTKAKTLNIVVGDEEEDGTTTFIKNIETPTGNDAIFDLSGRRVVTPKAKGIYIINGKKVIR